MGKLSTHVLDTATGRPAAGVRIELWAVGPGDDTLLETAVTNSDGRTDKPLLEDEKMRAGWYRIVFFVGEYYRREEHRDAGSFLDRVAVEFRIADDSAGYHVPLLVTPWSYTTYRGS
ncbi:MAG: hydroxyisourate hydrolase [Alkalispirochaetaceae bacterium]